MSQKPVLKRVLKWIVVIPIGVVACLLLLGWIIQTVDPEGTKQRKLALDKQDYRDRVAQQQADYKDSVLVASENLQKAKDEAIIKEGRVYSWAELPDTVKSKIYEYNSYFVGGWETPRNSTSFKKQDGFYIKAIIDNQKLAELSKSKAFQPEEVLGKNPFFLYGNYLNRWTFQNAQGQISETSKSDGFNTICIKRNGNLDAVWIGPIPEKPLQLTILGRGDDSETKPVYRF